ncbi:MAG: universal stress protein [Actinomycetota bacterium]|nr:universal stress protein [Actinomycetota bacterium]
MSEQLVVVGVDGSPASYTALRWALAHSERTGAQGEPVPPNAEREARAERELGQVVTAAMAWVPKEAMRVAVLERVVRGPAGPMLVSHAVSADLLVVGHGPRSIEMTHRSVSWYCVVHATCPVLVIPPAMATRRTLARATAEVPG